MVIAGIIILQRKVNLFSNKFCIEVFLSDLTPFFGSTCSTISTSTYASSLSPPDLKYIDEYEIPSVPRNTRAQFRQHIASAAASEFNSSVTSSVIGEITSCKSFLSSYTFLFGFLAADFRAALQTILISFPPSVRRALHLICRFIKRIGANTYLKLHETKSTFDYVSLLSFFL